MRNNIARAGRKAHNLMRYYWSRPPQLVFLHLPKCAGTSVHAMLREIYPSWQRCPERHNGLRTYSPAKLRKYDLLSGHYDFTSVQPNLSGRRLISFIRPPRSRLISLYNFLRAHRLDMPENLGLPLIEMAHALDIDDFFSDPRVRYHPSVRNGMVRYLSNVPQSAYRWEGSAPLVEGDDSQRLDEALNNLTCFDYVGSVALMSETTQEMFLRLNLSAPPIPHRRSAAKLMTFGTARMRVIETQRLAPQSQSLLDDLVGADEVLYRAAAALFGWSGAL